MIIFSSGFEDGLLGFNEIDGVAPIIVSSPVLSGVKAAQFGPAVGHVYIHHIAPILIETIEFYIYFQQLPPVGYYPAILNTWGTNWADYLSVRIGNYQGQLRWVLNVPATGDVEYVTAIDTGVFYHVKFTRQAGTGIVTLSIDGVQILEKTGQTFTPTQHVAIGVGPGDGDSGIIAVFDDIVIDDALPVTVQHTIQVSSAPINVQLIQPSRATPFSIQIDDGTDLTLEAPASSGNYTFDYWEVNEASAGVNALITLQSVVSDLAVIAVYIVKTKSGCFIATAAFGTPLTSEIQALRRFRDKCLPNTLTTLYYRTSPSIADAIRPKVNIKRLVRAGIRFPLKIIRT